MPALCIQAQLLDTPLYHLDGMEQLRHLDMLLSIPNLKAIQWTHVSGQPSPIQFLPVLRRIQQSGVRLIINQVDVDEMLSLIEYLDPGKIHFVIETSTPQDAANAVNTAQKACHKSII